MHRAEHTVDGVTTSSSAASHSKEEHSDRQFDTSGANRFGSGSDSNTTLDTGSSKGPGALVSQTSIGAGVMDFLKDAYEIGEDGTVGFTFLYSFLSCTSSVL
ncbi:unnamed protein product [Protopolystoma xenopodis]|uniref:Uncharacterized protein n=1 Tax=Protopolystoma xenopodis TaxID=117903 RepID=A0A448X2E6_9PLAT|nr:unnamed protein product [Protopolystoma xenopodis]